MANRLVTIARFTDPYEANLAKQFLADFGIESALTGQNFANMYPVPPLAKIELQTLESQAQEALKILESRKKQEH